MNGDELVKWLARRCGGGESVQISCTASPSNVRHRTYAHNSPENITLPRKRRFISSFGNVHEQYCITIRPKLLKSSSLSDLTRSPSEFSFDIFKQNELLTKETTEDLLGGSSGDATTLSRSRNQSSIAYMSWNFRGKTANKKSKMIPGTYGKKFASDYMKDGDNFELPSCPDNSSTSTAQSLQIGATFPFKSTPSGNLKVQTNQVVFQSSTVGVLLADPAQAKVKVKFEEGENDDDTYEDENYLETRLQYDYETGQMENNQTKVSDRSTSKAKCRRDDKGKVLASLGYTIAEPVDWMRVQLPKKRDLFQEFYRKIHNYMNTDTIIRIGHEEFHCHRIVLQIYSTFFDSYAISEIELPCTSVTPEAFKTIYEWMIFSGPENNKVLKRDNILELFCAAQYLSIKDLEEQCWSFIVNENLFTEDTAFALFRKAREKGIKPVMELMIPRVMRFFLPLVASRDFLDLQLEEVMALLKSNYICVTSEMEVLMAGVRWLYGNWSSRRSLAADIMRCVRFGLISPWQLVDIKRNPDNAEILEIVNEPEIQQMVDDGLAYVIIKYWYGNNCKSYHHWIDVLGLNEPSERNWIGDEKNHVTYKDFLKYLEQFMVPKDQMYQQMSVMQPPRRNEDNIMSGGNLRAMETDKLEMRKPRPNFPLPATLKAFSGEKEKPFPTMSEFFEDRKKGQGFKIFSPNRSPPTDGETNDGSRFSPERRRKSEQNQQDDVQLMTKHRNEDQQMIYVKSPSPHYGKQEQVHMCSVEYDREDKPGVSKRYEQYEPPEKDSTEELDTSRSEMISEVAETSVTEKQQYQTHGHGERRQSIAATFLASATAALSESKPPEAHSSSRPKAVHPSKHQPTEATQVATSKLLSPQISLFNESKEFSAKLKMNKLSNSVLGPSNKVYNTEGSLFHWERETVLVFGGTNSQLPHGTNGKNTGQEIYRFDPVTNVWENVGKIPEPRHHHSVAFLRGRVYLIGGADPRDDDIRGKSVVVSTVWSFEPVTKSWYSETGLSIPRKDFGLVVHRMALYVIGGQDKRGRVLRSVERYDPRTNTWSEVKSMSVARMAAATAKYREYIWVAGGMTGEKKRPVCDVVECYNSNTNEWTEIYSLRFPRCFCTLFPMNDKLYLVGGAGKISEKDKTASSVGAIDVWDWKQRQWLPHTEMSIPRHGHALAYLGTQLIIMGGITTIYTRVLNNVESFCCERDAWIRGVAPLPTPLFGHAAVTLPPASLM